MGQINGANPKRLIAELRSGVGLVNYLTTEEINNTSFGGVWQDETVNRRSGVVYTNSEEYVIVVSVMSRFENAGSAWFLRVNGLVVDLVMVLVGARSRLMAVVPPGATYSVDSNRVVSSWVEFKK